MISDDPRADMLAWVPSESAERQAAILIREDLRMRVELLAAATDQQSLHEAVSGLAANAHNFFYLAGSDASGLTPIMQVLWKLQFDYSVEVEPRLTNTISADNQRAVADHVIGELRLVIDSITKGLEVD